jgi:hypothetical protein
LRWVTRNRYLAKTLNNASLVFSVKQGEEMSMLKKVSVALSSLISLACLASLISCGSQNARPTPPPTPPNACPAEERAVTLQWAPTSEASLAKTYVAWDMNPDGTFANTGRGGNGNLGHSAKSGASMVRDPADSLIVASMPDYKKHTLHVYALDSQGDFLPENPVAKFEIAAQDCVAN